MTATTTQSLTSWLLDQIAADEAVARAATPGPWRYDPTKEWHTDPDMLARASHGRMTLGGEEFVGAGPRDATICVASMGMSDGPESVRDAAHIARHDPARVLAQCEAHRRIVAEHGAYPTPQRMVYGTITACETCGSVDDSPVEWPCATLRILATIYADRAGYQETWRP